MAKKALLAILDGWGLGTDPKVSAIDQANTPFIDSCYEKFPHTTLEASGLAVGLPFGQMGNSEVGHLNIGAGRVYYQSLPRINHHISDGTFFENKAFLKAAEQVKKNDSVS